LSEFEELLKKIQEQKPELTKQDIDDRIKQKIEKLLYSSCAKASNFSFTLLNPPKEEKLQPPLVK